MTSHYGWIDSLRCPDCRAAFSFTAVENEGKPGSNGHSVDPLSELRYGLLECRCFRYPVVDGVPILLKGHLGQLEWAASCSQGARRRGDRPPGDRGKGTEALIRCLAFTPRFKVLDRLPGDGGSGTPGPIPALSRKWIERRLEPCSTATARS